MPKKKKQKHRHKKKHQSTLRPALNPLQERIAEINRLKPIMAAAQQTAQRQRERAEQKQ